MTRKAAINQLFNLIKEAYELKSALLDIFGGFIE